MITCRDCGTEVSTLAGACPSCGRPVNASLPILQRRFRLVGATLNFGCITMFVVAAALFLLLFGHC